MTTVLELATDALELIGFQPAEAAVEAVDAETCRKALNNMMAEWEESGLDIDYVERDTVQDTLFVPDSAIGPMAANLAIYVAPKFDRIVTPALERRAKRGYLMLRTKYAPVSSTEYPETLPCGSGNSIRFDRPLD